ncbi:multidrug ABC transporter permease [Salipaludibacillus keqinensis]|uniref:Multidrug ABC transporter permease n=1 Tax=Salipaludibacillus keqinensis TaxID=2045207 RepID=A0A323TJ87_9BACI|nr:ABC transporter permease [Salipaludibacillus keqinensis]PYZ95001.1 multidrug ABC transporter permease [Salipaludibacillus keqinensis]
MKSVYLLQWQRFRRTPVMVVSFFLLTVLFVFTLAGVDRNQQQTVSTFANESADEEKVKAWIGQLNEEGEYHFILKGEQDVQNELQEGRVNFALSIDDDNFQMIVATDDPRRVSLEGHVHQVFRNELRLREVEEAFDDESFRNEVEEAKDSPVLTVNTEALAGNEEAFIYDNQLQTLFGMTLFFSIYTMMFSLLNVAEEKRWGTWDRLIISPLRKWQLYIGHLLYCFTIGYAQILVVFLLFKFGLGFDLGERFGTMLLVIGCYAFAIVALGMLLMGLVKSSQQLQAVIPIVATAIAMLGGAFWPVEIVTNDIVLFFSQGMPIFYALEALKGLAIYDRTFQEIAQPLSFLLLFGVVCMGIGVNLMERRG